jgi:hypothetical protein
MGHFSSFLQNPGIAAAPFNIAYKTDAKFWAWHEALEDEEAQRFTLFVKGMGRQLPPEIFTAGKHTFQFEAHSWQDYL